MIADGADVVFPGGGAARKSITGLTMPMERKERKERNLMNQSNETATKEERT